MKRFQLIFLLLILLNTLSGISQEFNIYLSTADLEVKDIATTNNVEKIPSDWILKADQKETGFTHITIISKGNNLAEFSLKPLDYTLFSAKFRNSIIGLKDDSNQKIELLENSKNEQALLVLYSKITSYFFSINERPQVATIYLKDSIDVYSDVNFLIDKKKEDKTLQDVYVGELSGAIVNISFYSGFIEKIEVKGTIDNIPITFSNKYSIGVSSLQNIKNFRNIKVISNYKHLTRFESDTTKQINNRNSLNRKERITVIGNDSITVKGLEKTSRNLESEEQYLYIYLNDLIDYQRIIDVNANDISPDKQTIGLDTLQKSAKLYKEESTKILEAVIFSDLIGTFDEENPNGIIQTEVSKRFNINTNRSDITSRGKWFSLLMPPFLISESWGAFEYLDAKVSLTKIEDDNKFLLPDTETGKLSLISLYQHRNFSVGGALNALAFENQNLKINTFFDLGFEFAKSGFKLTEESDSENLNFMEFNVELKFHLFPEKRYGLFISDKLSYYETLDDDNSTLSFDETSYWLNTFEFKAYLDVSTSAKIFARYKLIHESQDIDNNFSQFQIGLSFYLLEKNRKDK